MHETQKGKHWGQRKKQRKPERCKDNTSKDSFSRWKYARNLGYRLSGRWQDKVGQQNPEEKNFALGVAYACWNAVDVQNHLTERWDVRHQWQSENQDPEKHQHEADETQQWRDTLGEHVNLRVVVTVFLVLVLFLLSHSFSCTHRMAQDVREFVSSHPCMKWAFSLTFLISSSPSSSSSHSSSTSSSSFYPSTSLRLSSKSPVYFAKEMGSTDESFSNTGSEPKDYLLTETYVEFNQESMTERVCQRIGYVLDYESPRKHASSIVAWKALRWKRIFLWMDQRSKTTSHLKRNSNTMKHWELRSYCGSRLVSEFFLRFSSVNYKDTFKTG